MELSSLNISELIRVYSGVIKELKKRGILRTKNVIGELGEYLVLEYYEMISDLPKLSAVPLGTKNINAISQNGERYSIKSTSGNVTGVFYGLQPQDSIEIDKPIFEYVVVCKLDDDCELEGIYQLSWEGFQKHKKWHSRMNAWNIAVTRSMKDDSKIIYERTFETNMRSKNDDVIMEVAPCSNTSIQAIEWNKTCKVDHRIIRDAVAKILSIKLGCKYEKSSQSRYVTFDKTSALFVLSASYSEKNQEYWYSINDEIIPWLRPFPSCHIAFALGSTEQILVFTFETIEELLPGCLKTKEDLSIGKKPHFHLSFAVEGFNVFFKKKLPEREYVDVSKYLIKG